MNKRLPYISLGLCVVSWALTIFLFFFLNTTTEKSAVFYFNLGYSLLLELLFFAYIGFIRMIKTGHTNAVFAPVYGIINISYIITGFLLLLAWNLFFPQFVTFRLFIAILIIVTVVFIIVGSLVAKTQTSHQENLAIENKNAAEVKDLKAEFAKADQRFMSIMKKKLTGNETQSSVPANLSNLLNPVKFLPANALANYAVQQGLLEALQAINTWLDNIEKPEYTREQMETDIPRFISETKSKIEFIIQSGRK